MTASLNVAAGSGFTFAFDVPVRELTISVPGASNDFSPRQRVHLEGRVAFDTSMSTGLQGCPCVSYAWIRDMTTDTVSTAQYQTFESSDASSFNYSFDVEALFARPRGPRTYQLEVGLWDRNSTTNAANFLIDSSSSLSAMTFHFGPTGT